MNLGFPEMMFIFILALIIFGPKKLPEIGRQIGKGLAEFKRASREFQSQIEDEVRKLELDADIKNTIAPISLTDTVSSTPPALTVGNSPTVEEATTASTPEVAAAAAHPDYTVEHLPESSSLPKADSAANA
ncbi:MAG TPA: TatA/E family twin arginine-targeting protein translocase [Terriglobales bacterium]|jgi:TatA/E family protein of Tat protein translocase|nr:TatA/E family twin arginine-targeting protein translocase [Terriglobales bacterium]